MMEMSLYADDGMMKPNKSMQDLKRTMKLDFNGSSRPSKQAKLFSPLLNSPDLNLLKLASPELEKLLIQGTANNGILTTPTPGQVGSPGFFFPKTVTEEQKDYARGFADALAQLHQSEHPMQTCDSAGQPEFIQLSTVPSTMATTTVPGGPVLTSLETVCTSNSTATGLSVTYSNGSSNIPQILQTPPIVTSSEKRGAQQPQYLQHPMVTKIKEEPQTVPNYSDTPPMSPVDMEEQERIKLDRKRLRNRIAASKCRRRKLDRISRLEDKVKEIKGENSDLKSRADTLKDQICMLKQQIMEHHQSGCQIMISPGMEFKL